MKILAHLESLEETPLLRKQKSLLQNLFDMNARSQNYVITRSESQTQESMSIENGGSVYDVLTKEETKQLGVRVFVESFELLTSRN